MSVFYWIGVAVVALVVLLAAWVAMEIICNIYGGIKGAYRLRAIKGRYSKKKAKHWQTIRLGLRNWIGGNRYKDGFGTYWTMGGLRVPVDGRDKIERDNMR